MAGILLGFSLKSGTFREDFQVDHSQVSLLFLRNRAAEFIQKNYPDNGYGKRLDDHILLYRHDFGTLNVLQLINNSDEIVEGTLVEAVVSTNPLSERLVVHPHSLLVHNYRSPTFCDFCGELLLGIFKQGLQCEACFLNCHKRCALKVPNNCSGMKERRRTSVISLSRISVGMSSVGTAIQTSTPKHPPGGDTLGVVSQLQLSPMRSSQSSAQLATPSIMVTPDEHQARSEFLSPISIERKEKRSASWSGRPLWMELSEATQLKLPHTFQVHTYKVPTICQVCRRLLKGIIRQGYQCKDCDYNCHKKCRSKAPKNCSCSVIRSPSFYLGGEEMVESGLGSLGSSIGKVDGLSPTPSPSSGRRGSVDSQKKPEDSGGVSDEEMDPEKEEQVENVPLMRVCAGKTAGRGTEIGALKSGWLVHFTDRNGMRRKHFWRLDTEHLILYYDDRTKQFFKKLSLSDILEVRLLIPVEQKTDHHLEIISNAATYYISATGDKNREFEVLSAWQAAVKQAVMPIGPKVENVSQKKVEPRMSHLGGVIESEEAFSQLYQIRVAEELGAGCFGRVFGGVQRVSRNEVAIKVIDKRKFPKEREEELRTEINILKTLKHPGVVSFEKMMETETRIFVVMEKMAGGDLLEMIVHHEDRKFSERLTKFFLYQALMGLKYLHSQDIAHCDIKPENMLLGSDSDFPQIKLCDFGYSKIIGEKGFRHSMVGTMAYLAPEVLKYKKFNRALDMWSTGVVTYVCLSGTFPFDDQSDLVEQIKDWEKGDNIFRDKKWKHISDLAKDFVSSLLEVNVQNRLDVNRTLQHKWLQNYTLWSDLRKLEESLGFRYLTRREDDGEWERYEERFRIQPTYKGLHTN